jgi:Zn-dependent M28 family amino/carboxypeptidase
VNDSGSGVAVLLAIAKAVTTEWYALGSEYAKSSEKKDPPFGIDLAFWDAEDWGNPHGAPETYCLGSQYWAKNVVPAGYKAEFGINFDMVGRVGSLFPAEGYSQQKAPQVVKAIRDAAAVLGHSDLFPPYEVGPITDDHYFVMQGTGIPMADIIYMDPDGRFPPEWHTTDDTSAVISRDVLKAVAQVAVQVMFGR